MSAAVEWDAELIRRYDLTGPRYTSYPTAPNFHSGIGAAQHIQALRRSAALLRPLSLYLHIPFCANVCYYCACNKVITKDRGRALPYVQHLEEEIRLASACLDPRQTVEQLHFGGGTPTYLSHDQLRHLLGTLRRYFRFLEEDSGDYSIEIDPREADWSTMGLLRELGFNRISLGVQDLDPHVQRAVNRLQSLEQTRTIIDAAHTLQFRSVSIDLIYGLPLQTPQSFARTLEEIIALQPDRLSLFNYAHLPERFKPQRRIASEQLPPPAAKLEMLQASIERLAAAGYRHIGMDHFALADDELAIAQEDGTLQRNFQGYSTRGYCDLIGFGVSAISKVGELYSQNDSDLAHYQNRVAGGELPVARGVLSGRDDQLRHAVIQQLICHFQLDFKVIEQAFDINFPGYFAPLWARLRAMANDGLIRLDDQHIEVLPAGRLLVRSLCRVFDGYWQPENPTGYSRVI